jgi:hypothetical protein
MFIYIHILLFFTLIIFETFGNDDGYDFRKLEAIFY